MTITSLLRNLAAITGLVYVYFAFEIAPDPRLWHWVAWLVLAFWYVVLIGVYWDKIAKARSKKTDSRVKLVIKRLTKIAFLSCLGVSAISLIFGGWCLWGLPSISGKLSCWLWRGSFSLR